VHNFYFESSVLMIDNILAPVNDAPDLPNFKRMTMYLC
jgi:hypothetical protein